MRAPSANPAADIAAEADSGRRPFAALRPAPRPSPDSDLIARCRPIEILVLDVDGVLTDGRIIYTDQGIELKSFHVRDGSALVIWRRLGKRAAIISGRASEATERRAAELGVATVVQGAADKRAAFRQILEANDLQPPQACYMGDDLPDLGALAACGLAVAVADACAEVKAAAHYVTRATGGQGAVREVVEWILRGQGRWAKVVEQFGS